MTNTDLRDRLPEALLDTDEVSAWLAISPATLRTWRTRGGGPTATLVGRRVRYQRSDVQAWLDDRRETRTRGAA